jgi:hypothetical protein
MKLRFLLAGMLSVAGCLCLAFSAVLLQGHFQLLKDMKEYALPLAAELPPLKERAQVLKDQVELSQLQASMRPDSARENLHLYVLPGDDKLDRLLAFFESTRTFLERKKLLRSMSAIDVGDPVPATGAGMSGLQSRTLSFEVQLKKEGREQLFGIIDWSGLLTVGDALSQKDIDDLFALTESENSATIVPIEAFLSADLLEYVQDPRLVDAKLERALPSAEFLKSFRDLLAHSRFEDAKEFLQGDLGRTLVARKLWPVQFLTVEREENENLGDGWETVRLTLKAYSRREP